MNNDNLNTADKLNSFKKEFNIKGATGETNIKTNNENGTVNQQTNQINVNVNKRENNLQGKSF